VPMDSAPEAFDLRAMGPGPQAWTSIDSLRPDPRRWRILTTDTALIVLDERTLNTRMGLGEPQLVEVPFLAIDRRSGKAREGRARADDILSRHAKSSGPGHRELRVHAVLGALSATDSSGLLVVTKADCVCELDGKSIYEVAQVGHLSLATMSGADTLSPLGDGILKLLSARGFYFSQDFDITHTLQWKKRRVLEARRLGEEPVPKLPDGSTDLLAAADQRFVWNRRLVEQLTRQDVSARWFVPLMQGHVQSLQCSEPHPDAPDVDVQLTLLLISRRGSRRAGTRYNARGLDDDGDVGNLVETEQLARIRLIGGLSTRSLNCPQGWLSLVQLRGSVPLFWEQLPQGPVQLTREPELAAAAFSRQQVAAEEAYGGDVFYCNLLADASPAERSLSDALETQLAFSGNSSASGSRQGSLYCHFDFHGRVHGATEADFDSELDGLMTEVAPFLQRSAYLDATSASSSDSGPPEPRRWQAGTLRTNCLDCLDRTNVVQFYVAWTWLRGICQQHPALHKFLDTRRQASTAAADVGGPKDVGPAALQGLFNGYAAMQKATGSLFDGLASYGVGGGANDDLLTSEAASVLRQQLQELWADQGDRLSQLYTGAGSIMSTMLRQGKRSTYSVLEQSWTGINRAFQASFQDGQRQEAIDLLLGTHRSVADLPCFRVTTQQGRSPADRSVGSMGANSQRSSQRTPVGNLKVWVGSWNLAGKESAWESASPEAWAEWIGSDLAELPDVAVFCLQEFLELTAKSIVLSSEGDSERSARFESVALGALGARGANCGSNGRSPGSSSGSYVKVRAVSMVGLHCVAYVRADLASHVRDVRVARVKSGVFGSAGNKGAVAVRFEVLSTSLCFLCAHFESGADKTEQRTAQFRDALRCFAGASPPIPAAHDHDIFTVAGDLNVRLDLPPGTDADGKLHAMLRGSWDAGSSGSNSLPATDVASPETAWRQLLRYDQLLSGTSQHLRPLGVLEGPINFPPTYRLLIGSDEYDPARVPAWCDRVLYKAVAARLLSYRATGSLRGSDHRPVSAVIEAPLLGGASDQGLLEARSPARIAGGFSQGAPAEPQLAHEATSSRTPVPPTKMADLLGSTEDDLAVLQPCGAPSSAAGSVVPRKEDGRTAPMSDLLGASVEPLVAASGVGDRKVAPPGDLLNDSQQAQDLLA